MPPALSRLYAPAFERAALTGFALFPDGVPSANPVNAAPYVCTPAQLAAVCTSDPRRAALIGSWSQMLGSLASLGLDPVFSLVGGSVLDKARGMPGDFDCIVFYRCLAQAGGGPGQLADLACEAARDGIDARFVPIDGPPIVLAKSLAFFTLLYAQARPGRACHGLVLVDHDTP